MHVVDPRYIGLLKEPFGLLIRENDADKEAIIPFVTRSDKVITVGDTTTEKLVRFGFVPDLSFIDNKEKRAPKYGMLEYSVDKKIILENSPGGITSEAIQLIREITATEFKKRIQVKVRGEEDLLALPLFMYSPDRWVIFYGQPNEGLVVVEAGEAIRKRARSIFNKAFILKDRDRV